jgi:hypothetical protein
LPRDSRYRDGFSTRQINTRRKSSNFIHQAWPAFSGAPS